PATQVMVPYPGSPRAEGRGPRAEGRHNPGASSVLGPWLLVIPNSIRGIDGASGAAGRVHPGSTRPRAALLSSGRAGRRVFLGRRGRRLLKSGAWALRGRPGGRGWSS